MALRSQLPQDKGEDTRQLSQYRVEAVTPTVSVRIDEHQIEDARAYLSREATPEMLDPQRLATGGKREILELLRQCINEQQIAGLPPNPPEEVLEALYRKSIGLGVIEEFLANPDVNQINVLGPKQIILQVNGVWSPVTDTSQLFRDVNELRQVIGNIARRQGKELSPYVEPIVDLRIGHPPLRVQINQTRRDYGISVFIRRGRYKPFSIQKLIKLGDFDQPVADLFIEAAQRLIGCIILGPVGTGKTVILEAFIDHMPNVPIVLVDDAGDCHPSHPFCAVFDLPGSSYSPRDTPLLTLGSLTKAALRAGQVLIVAETRGAEEAGVLISDAPSMKAVCTTAHGDNAANGLSRLVAIAQRSDAYRGSSNNAGLRSDLTAAFPFVIEMMQRGDRRFINKIYHNRGWNSATNQWDLHTMATAVFHDDGRISWEVLDDNLDSIRPEIALDRMNRGVVLSYERRDPLRLLSEANQHLANGNFDEATNIFSILVQLDPDNTKIRRSLISALQQSGRAHRPAEEADRAIYRLKDLINARKWYEADELVKKISSKPGVYAFVRQNFKLPLAIEDIQRGIQTLKDIEAQVNDAHVLTKQVLSWKEYERALENLLKIDVNLLPEDWKAKAKETHAMLLAKITLEAPIENSYYYQQQLVQLIGRDQAQELKRRLKRSTGVPEDGVQ